MPDILVHLPIQVLQLGMMFGIPIPNPIRMPMDVSQRGAYVWLEGHRRQLQNLDKAMANVSQELTKIFKANFDASGRPPWAKPSPNTLFSKDMADLNRSGLQGRARQTRLATMKARAMSQTRAGLLVDSGDYKASWVDTSHPDHVSRVGKTSVEEGSRHRLAVIHERGTGPYTIRPRHASHLRFLTVSGPVFAKEVKHPGLPARPVARLSPEDVTRILTVVADHIKDFR